MSDYANYNRKNAELLEELVGETSRSSIFMARLKCKLPYGFSFRTGQT
ncbi:hypothetical protein [Aquimarina rubra]|uniref:Uncharacterized protein n=1 Tax=Aquimarina rubra TaxID=1920033 RepID=A0ABW5LBG8_9FLAO